MIKDSYQKGKTVFSIEVFPPKKESDIALLYRTLDDFKALNLDFISITYGAGGSTSKKTIDIASYIQNECNIEALAHLTCSSLVEASLNKFLEELKENQINNVLALRGDRPQDMSEEDFKNRPYQYALDLISIIRNKNNSCIAGACYPEVHPESYNQKEDISFLKAKVDAGTDFLITQMFFDNTKFFNFYEQVRNKDISIPISAGIMPITSVNQVKTIVELSGSTLPAALINLIDKYKVYPEDFKKAGLDYATNQIKELLEYGVDGIHLFTLNKADSATTILRNLGF